jgi:Dolichyl-phosphate-mannose-protein mannosyltransferase
MVGRWRLQSSLQDRYSLHCLPGSRVSCHLRHPASAPWEGTAPCVCYFEGKAFCPKSPEAEIENTMEAGLEPAKADAKTVWSETRVVRSRPIENWIVLATLVASAVVAWWHIRSVTIWYDEAITLLTTSGHAIPDWSLGMQQFKPSADLPKILSDLYKYDVHPPLYFWTLAIWRVLFGGSLDVARALSALFTLGSLALLYRYAIEVGIRWPSVPVVIYALSAAGLRYAYNARPYAMATFLIVLTLYLAHRKSKWTGICAAACVATHYFAALCVGPIVAIGCLLCWKTNRRWGFVDGALLRRTLRTTDDPGRQSCGGTAAPVSRIRNLPQGSSCPLERGG